MGAVFVSTKDLCRAIFKTYVAIFFSAEGREYLNRPKKTSRGREPRVKRGPQDRIEQESLTADQSASEKASTGGQHAAVGWAVTLR